MQLAQNEKGGEKMNIETLLVILVLMGIEDVIIIWFLKWVLNRK